MLEFFNEIIVCWLRFTLCYFAQYTQLFYPQVYFFLNTFFLECFQPNYCPKMSLTICSNLHVCTFTINHHLFPSIVCIGVSTPLKNTPAPLSCQAPLKSANCPSPPFLGNPPYILVFREPPIKLRFFREPPKYQSFSSFTPNYLLNGTKFSLSLNS